MLGRHIGQPADGALLLKLGLRVGCSKHADHRADEVLVGHVVLDELILVHLGPLALLALLTLLALLALNALLTLLALDAALEEAATEGLQRLALRHFECSAEVSL